ncbi:DUF211 domain-containing protein [Haladaptatus caseinilyticus]|uniref:DUF211 domain-containing protein n=1 Tax=Haladaptatus caseinilyticus TaxID=2993314 RepID=UPI00224B6D9B|nr:DUF211 domain-containing protein [Haladaptatus caseinilyticus]
MAPVKRLVIDVLKPHEPPTIEFAQHIAGTSNVAAVNATLIELDQEVKNLKLTLEGDGIVYDDVRTSVKDAGGTIHSVDQVVCGEHLVEDAPTPQD